MFLCCRAVFPSMKARGRGKIVNISSSRVWVGTPNRLHYTTAKAGVIGLTRALARAVGEFGITVNAVAPSMTQGETQVQSSAGNYLAARVAGRAIERVQVPADLVGTVMFLSSLASDFITGQTINVDGGKAMHWDGTQQFREAEPAEKHPRIYATLLITVALPESGLKFIAVGELSDVAEDASAPVPRLYIVLADCSITDTLARKLSGTPAVRVAGESDPKPADTYGPPACVLAARQR
jgi:Enoyl-(Acyl carrier protein) reductase